MHHHSTAVLSMIGAHTNPASPLTLICLVFKMSNIIIANTAEYVPTKYIALALSCDIPLSPAPYMLIILHIARLQLNRLNDSN
jgi:hypothetical protein